MQNRGRVEALRGVLDGHCLSASGMQEEGEGVGRTEGLGSAEDSDDSN